MKIYELIEKKGAIDVNTEGTIIEIRDGSGIITRCPQCNRTLKNKECAKHGKVEGKIDFRIKAIIDDGTGAISTILNREISEKILKKTLKEYKKMDQENILNEIIKKLFTQRVIIKGNALSDDFGLTLIAKDADIIDIDIKQKSETILQDLEEL